ncbi:MAG: hypothetical protein WCQ60_01440 [bacterium]
MNNFEIIHHEICRRYIELYKNCPSILKHIPDMVGRVTKNDINGQITLLPYFFKKSLTPNLSKNVSDESVILLGVANLAGWIAYRIYDDFMDNNGHQNMLSLAHMSDRYCIAIYLAILPDHMHSMFHSLMNQMNESNAWEHEASFKPTNIPDYKKCQVLGYKSLPHSFGPLTILVLLGYSKNTPEMKKCISFFYNYLIARQLSDDALDWQHDLKQGFINPVAAKILTSANKQHHISGDIEALKNIFKNEVTHEVTSLITKRLSSAQIFLNQNRAIQYKEYLQSLLDAVKN